MIRACDALYVVEWRMPFGISTDDLGIVNVRVTDGGPRRRPLGFYLYETRSTAHGLVLRFATGVPRHGGLFLTFLGGDLLPTALGGQYSESIHLENAPPRSRPEIAGSLKHN
jgi:hypothetical protein